MWLNSTKEELSTLKETYKENTIFEGDFTNMSSVQSKIQRDLKISAEEVIIANLTKMEEILIPIIKLTQSILTSL